jgi:hypothetical protein
MNTGPDWIGDVVGVVGVGAAPNNTAQQSTSAASTHAPLALVTMVERL